jgi:TatD DNase family protein
MTKRLRWPADSRHSFVLRHSSFVLRHSCFVLHVMFFDTHCHLDQQEFDPDRREVIARARAAGVKGILCVAVSAASSQAVLRLAEDQDLLAAVGIHPNSTAEAAADDWQRVAALADHPRVVALGETGLDRYWDYAPLAVQQEYLDRHLRLAQQRDLPVILHCRDAAADLMPMLRAAAARGPIRGIMHAFSGDVAWAAECVSLGLHASFAGSLTYSNKKFDQLRAAARSIPDDRLLVETDSPYLVPQVFRGKQKRNEPANVVHTAAFLADLRGVPVDQIAALTTANARRLFGLPE